MSRKFSTLYPFLLVLFAQGVQTEKADASFPRGACLIQKQSQVQGGADLPVEDGDTGISTQIIIKTTEKAIQGAAALQLAKSKDLAMTQALRWSYDIFGDAGHLFHHGNLTNETNDYNIYLSTSQWDNEDKAILGGTVIILLLIDIFILQTLHVSGLYCHLLMVGLWVGIGIAFNFVIMMRKGSVSGIEWFTGYCLEWLLSMDNLFVFHIIFRAYGTPKEALHKALFFGILGAIFSRLCFFLVVSRLLEFVNWFRFVAGVFLMWSGIQAAREDEEDEDQPSLQDYSTVRYLKACLGSRLLPTYGEDSRSLMEKQGNQLCFTLLLPVIVTLEITDLVFALDSVSAKAAQIPNYWVAVSSSILAMFGNRAMFFVVQDLVDMFHLLKYGLCFILVFIGMELIVSDYVQLPPQAVCAVILSVFIISVAGSAATGARDSGFGGAAEEVLENHAHGKATIEVKT